jgi:hypothetical protein
VVATNKQTEWPNNRLPRIKKTTDQKKEAGSV